jgi:hypothetical protein
VLAASRGEALGKLTEDRPKTMIEVRGEPEDLGFGIGVRIVLPVGVDDAALDACLGALETATPAGTRVWLADDAQAGPRGYAVIEQWLARTALKADYSRRQRSVGEVAHLDEVLAACGDADVAVLAADAVPLPGWLDRLHACLASDGAIASATPWSAMRSRPARPRRSWRPGARPPTRRPARRSCAIPEAPCPRRSTKAAPRWARRPRRSPRSSTRWRTASANCLPWTSPDFPTPSGASSGRAAGRS